MDQALENIRGRIDAFGTAEPLLFVTGDTIEVQIPLARGTIEERDKTQFCPSIRRTSPTGASTASRRPTPSSATPPPVRW